MSSARSVDPFVSSEAEVAVDAATSRILKQRVKTAAEGRTVSPKAARQRIRRWLSKSSIASATTKTR